MGWTVISIGIIGLVLPIIPGILLIVVGSSMIGSKTIPLKIGMARDKLKTRFKRKNHIIVQ